MLILNIGLPGSGKSTVMNQLNLPSDDFKIVSPDRIRHEQFGVIYNRRIEPQVWKITHALVEGYFRLGKSVYIDATNLVRSWREDWLSLAKKYEQPVLGIFFEKHLNQVLKQNEQRPIEWTVDRQVIIDMYNSIQPPEQEEGFDTIITLADDKLTDKVLQDIVKTIESFSGINLQAPRMNLNRNDHLGGETPMKWI